MLCRPKRWMSNCRGADDAGGPRQPGSHSGKTHRPLSSSIFLSLPSLHHGLYSALRTSEVPNDVPRQETFHWSFAMSIGGHDVGHGSSRVLIGVKSLDAKLRRYGARRKHLSSGYAAFRDGSGLDPGAIRGREEDVDKKLVIHLITLLILLSLFCGSTHDGNHAWKVPAYRRVCGDVG